MKKITTIIFLLFGFLLLTGCSMEDLENEINEIKEKGDCSGTRENGQCCTAEYSGTDVDSSGNCPGIQEPGDRLIPKKDPKKCYRVSCEDLNE